MSLLGPCRCRLIVLLTNEQLDYKVRPDNLSSMTSELELSFGSRESSRRGARKFSRSLFALSRTAHHQQILT